MGNLNFKRAVIIASGLFFGNITFAQQANNKQPENLIKPFPADSTFRSWSLGFNAGVLSQYTIFLGSPDFKDPAPSLGYGFYIKKQFVPFFGIQADYLGGKLQGKNATAIGVPSPYSKYDSQISWAGALSANVTLANFNWRDSQSHLQLYSTLGAGMAGYTPTLYDYNGDKVLIDNLGTKTGKSYTEIIIPIGLGLKYAIAQGINIDLGYSVVFVDADNIDGYKYAGNNDKFAYAHLGLEFALGKSTKPQLAGHNVAPAMRNEYTSGIKSLQKQVSTLKTILKTKTDSIQVQLNNQKAQTARLEEMVTKYKLTIEDTKIVDEVIQRLEFELKKSDIKPSSFPSLDRLAQLMLTKKLKLKIDGYTDNTGPDWRNLSLSNNRANAVKRYLIKKGVDGENIIATGYGNMKPIASNETLEGRRKNRRVEFTLN